ncbi:GNAT family N-acetyltransferase [Roseibium aestuarii]|uniref:GNAT family N-acetyltransferase n=1 Tax=Roseibium aestuarii TaxID=2600299 RepID=A0ABW4JUU3_9HYPH|nr:GNAT family N-acetyltransferase [Roseibium aestuarii]
MPNDDTPLRIERWDPDRHDRSGFDCGVQRLDNYLALSARRQQRDDMTRVHVAVEEGQTRILGYSAINMGMMNVAELASPPRATPSHGEIPVLFLGQIAVDRRAQGCGLGGILLHHVFEKACVIAADVGCRAVLLDVMSDGGPEAFQRRKDWYVAFGFRSFASRPSRLFMTLRQIRQIVQR